jgi:hypothetical protein
MVNVNIVFSSSVPTSATATTTSSTLVTGDRRNQFIFMRNLSETTTIYLAVGVAAEVGKGIALLPLESYEFGTTCLPAGNITGIVSAGTANVSILLGR